MLDMVFDASHILFIYSSLGYYYTKIITEETEEITSTPNAL